LNINTVADDVSVASVGMHSQRVSFKAGELWQPMDDGSPKGPRLSILASGRAIIEMTQTGRAVKSLVAGNIIVEGICAQFGASMRAVTENCEIYQFYKTDFMIAASTVSETTPWIWRFKLLEKEATTELTGRLQNMQGLIESVAKHPGDEEIRKYSTLRQSNVKLAKQRRDIRNGDANGKLPDISSPVNSDMSESMDLTIGRRSPAKKPYPGVQAKNCLSYAPGQSISVYPVFHLPFVKDDSTPKGGKPLLRSTKSEAMLRSPGM